MSGPFVMFQSGIAHRIVNDLGRAFNETLLIGILDSQDKIAALMFCNQVCV